MAPQRGRNLRKMVDRYTRGPCLSQMHVCPLCMRAHHLCTTPPPPRETQDKILSVQAVRRLTAKNICPPPIPTNGRN